MGLAEKKRKEKRFSSIYDYFKEEKEVKNYQIIE